MILKDIITKNTDNAIIKENVVIDLNNLLLNDINLSTNITDKLDRIANNIKIIESYENCANNCANSCVSSCSSKCTASCSASCAHACTGDCSGECKGSCSGGATTSYGIISTSCFNCGTGI